MCFNILVPFHTEVCPLKTVAEWQSALEKSLIEAAKFPLPMEVFKVPLAIPSASLNFSSIVHLIQFFLICIVAAFCMFGRSDVYCWLLTEAPSAFVYAT